MKRIIAGIFVREGKAVQSIGFQRYLPIGDPVIIAETYDRWNVDEIIMLDISATKASRKTDLSTIEKIRDRISTPFCVGGGIRSYENAADIIKVGADKIAVNNVLSKSTSIINSIAEKFGRQAIVASIDVIESSDDNFVVYDYLNSRSLDVNFKDWIRICEKAGAGEILVNVVDRDGQKCGYSKDIVDVIPEEVETPIILCGGAGSSRDIEEAFSWSHIDGVVAANFWAFSEHSIAIVQGNIRAGWGHSRFPGAWEPRFRRGFDERPLPPEEHTLDALVNRAL